jgi:hypothetical protein
VCGPVKPCLVLVCGYQFTDHLSFKAVCWIMKKIRVFGTLGQSQKLHIK